MKVTTYTIEKSIRDHAVEWSATALSIIGSIVNANAYIEGFYIWGFANILWSIFAIKYKHWGLLTLNLVFVFINIFGLYTWITTGFGKSFI